MKTNVRIGISGIAVLTLLVGGITVLPWHSLANHLECSDGVDNDGDAYTDFPADPDCDNASDDTEAGSRARAATSSSRSSSRSSSQVSSTLSSSSASSLASTQSVAGVVLGITDSHDTVRQGQSLIYVISVKNTGIDTITTNVDLTLTSYINTITADQGGTVSDEHVSWKNIQLQAGQQQLLTVLVNLKPTIADGTELIARVTASKASSTDSTIVASNPGSVSFFTAQITDNVQVADRGQTLTYVMTVTNKSTIERSTDVRLDASGFVDIENVDPQSTFDSASTTWKNNTFKPNETKIFIAGGKVQRTTPNFASATTKVFVDSVTASDDTSIQFGSVQSSSAVTSSDAASSAQGNTPSSQPGVLFSKTSDTDEILPGGAVRYTLTVQNILVNSIENAIIIDRFDGVLLEISDAGGGSEIAAGQLRWVVPRLDPGAVWTQSYTLKATSNLPQGTVLNNVATISGDDLNETTLQQKVVVVRTNIVEHLPSTGAAYDLLFVLLALPLAGACMAVQRRI